MVLLLFQTKCSKKILILKLLIFQKIGEISGLEILDGNFLTHNDSGGGVFYLHLIKAEKLSEHLIEGAKNTDWESLASDENTTLRY